MQFMPSSHFFPMLLCTSTFGFADLHRMYIVTSASGHNCLSPHPGSPELSSAKTDDRGSIQSAVALSVSQSAVLQGFHFAAFASHFYK